ELLRETREEVSRADSKTAIVLAAALVVAGLFGSSTLNGKWTPFSLSLATQMLWWPATALALVGIGLLCASIYPNVGNQTSKQVLGYFGHVNQYASRDELSASLRDHASQPLVRLSDQLIIISRIV